MRQREICPVLHLRWSLADSFYVVKCLNCFLDTFLRYKRTIYLLKRFTYRFRYITLQFEIHALPNSVSLTIFGSFSGKETVLTVLVLFGCRYAWVEILFDIFENSKLPHHFSKPSKYGIRSRHFLRSKSYAVECPFVISIAVPRAKRDYVTTFHLEPRIFQWAICSVLVRLAPHGLREPQTVLLLLSRKQGPSTSGAPFWITWRGNFM